MVECVFTLDYEIYGNGDGSLQEHVFQPANELSRIFDAADAKLVIFVEAAELEMLEISGNEPAIEMIKTQIQAMYRRGHEIALHLHPQWYNARKLGGQWELDYSEYNLCLLSRERIEQLVDRSIAWLRTAIGDSGYTPLSFRAGNWLLQPTRFITPVLTSRGIKIDSSVFKGGYQSRHRLDYRAACRNGWFWRFSDDVCVTDLDGELLELPIYTERVPFWRMLTLKRVELQQRRRKVKLQGRTTGLRWDTGRIFDRLRWYYPMKFDFCRMTLAESTAMLDRVLCEDAQTPRVYKPVVAIGHTKDLVDPKTVAAFLAWLRQRSIPITTLACANQNCANRAILS